MKDWSDNPSHHEQTLLPRSYTDIWLQTIRTTRKETMIQYRNQRFKKKFLLYGNSATDLTNVISLLNPSGNRWSGKESTQNSGWSGSTRRRYWTPIRYTSLQFIGLSASNRKEMFHLTTHSNTFYLRLYGVRHMVKDHSDSERGNPLLPHRLLFPINSKGSFICTIPQTG